MSLPTPADQVRALRSRAKKNFGQHFLTDPTLLDRIVGLASPNPGQRVIEIGPGPGGLTVRMLAHGLSVVAIEADRDMVAHLEDSLGQADGLTVQCGDATSDALDRLLDTQPDAVVANLPYNAAAPILFRLLDHPTPPPVMVLMFQLEVARRVACSGADRHFGPLGLASNLLYETGLAMRLPPGAFSPPPKVDSGVVRFVRRAEPLANADERAAARVVARAAFAQRRKMLRKSLRGLVGDPIQMLTSAQVAPTARPEALRCEDFVRIGRVYREMHDA